MDEAFLFSQSAMSEALAASGYGAHLERLNTPYTPQLTGEPPSLSFISFAVLTCALICAANEWLNFAGEICAQILFLLLVNDPET